MDRTLSEQEKSYLEKSVLWMITPSLDHLLLLPALLPGSPTGGAGGPTAHPRVLTALGPAPPGRIVVVHQVQVLPARTSKKQFNKIIKEKLLVSYRISFLFSLFPKKNQLS